MGKLESVFAEVAQPGGWQPDEAVLESLCEVAESAYPNVSIGREDFVRHLAERGDVPSDAGEFYLAVACVLGDRRALEVFKSSFLDAANEAVRHMHLARDLADDVVQKTSQKLLVADGSGAIKLLRYAGQGKLRSLIKVVATRTALSELRKDKREVALPEHGPDAFEAPAENDAELGFIKEKYRAEFKVAFEAAVDGLTERERNLLRLHLLRGVTLAALADIYGVHRATVTRWLAAAREALLANTRARLGERLGLGRAEIESVMGWIGSRLDASVSRVLATRQDG